MNVCYFPERMTVQHRIAKNNRHGSNMEYIEKVQTEVA